MSKHNLNLNWRDEKILYILKVITKSLRGKVENVHKERRPFLVSGHSFSQCFVLPRNI